MFFNNYSFGWQLLLGQLLLCVNGYCHLDVNILSVKKRMDMT